jgi:hypothetical protein
MGRAMRSTIWLLFVLGCGGKIVETAPFGEPTNPNPDAPKNDGQQKTGFVPVPTTDPAPSNPTPASVTPLDACEVLCERDARCDTTLPALPVNGEETGDCKMRCEKRLAGKCGIDEWLLCYASSIAPNACTPLPDECKPAFCAWASCAKQPVSNCE